MNAVMLTEDEVSIILDGLGWPAVIDAVAETFTEEAHGNIISPAKVIMQIEEHNNDYRVMPSYMKKYPNYCGTKLACACPDNPKKHQLPLVQASFILNDARTQKTIMVAGASTTTAWRTAAASAVAVSALYNERPAQTLGIIGCGLQAYYHIPAISAIVDVKEILVADINLHSISRLKEHFENLGDPRIVSSCKEEIFELCDIVVTMTPTTKPHIFAKDLPDRSMVISAIGGDSDRKIELEPAIMAMTDHYCDSYEQVSHTGLVMRAMEEGIITADDLKSIGDYMVGKVKPSGKKIKLFMSTGVALEDLIVNILVYENQHLLA